MGFDYLPEVIPVERYPDVLALNEAALPHVNSLSLGDLTTLADQAFYFRMIAVDGAVAGFMLALTPGQDYQSLNYRWFSQSYDSFVYVDRIVVDPGFAGRGIGQRLYQDLTTATRGVAPRITCEVNLSPPNPRSLAFHQRLGFDEVGQQPTEDGHKQVSLLCKPV